MPSHLYVILLSVCLCCGCVPVMSLPKTVSVVQITLNSHVRNLIEVIIQTLCYEARLSVYPVVLPVWIVVQFS